MICNELLRNVAYGGSEGNFTSPLHRAFRDKALNRVPIRVPLDTWNWIQFHFVGLNSIIISYNNFKRLN